MASPSGAAAALNDRLELAQLALAAQTAFGRFLAASVELVDVAEERGLKYACAELLNACRRTERALNLFTVAVRVVPDEPDGEPPDEPTDEPSEQEG